KRRESVEVRNQLDGLVYQTEKNLGEHGSEVDAEARSTIESALADAKAALESNDVDRMRSAMERLTQAQHKLAEAMYAKAARAGGAEGQPPPRGDGAAQQQPGAGGGRDDVVDADFEEVKE
ncbi:MAG: Hsp70 family protein, partial [Candidatus Binatia bacterium]